MDKIVLQLVVTMIMRSSMTIAGGMGMLSDRVKTFEKLNQDVASRARGARTCSRFNCAFGVVTVLPTSLSSDETATCLFKSLVSSVCPLDPHHF